MASSQENFNIAVMKEAQFKTVMILLLLQLLGYAKVLKTDNNTDNFWLNETLLLREYNNATNYSNGHGIISEISKDNNIAEPVDPMMKIVIIALLLHALIIGGALIIYCVFYCKSRASRKDSGDIKRRLQSPLTLQHVPNASNCPCHGCRVARQILSGLIAQQIITERLNRP